MLIQSVEIPVCKSYPILDHWHGAGGGSFPSSVVSNPLSNFQGGASIGLDVGATVQQTFTPQDLDTLVNRMVDMRLKQHQEQQQRLAAENVSSANEGSSTSPHVEPIMRKGMAGSPKVCVAAIIVELSFMPLNVDKFHKFPTI